MFHKDRYNEKSFAKALTLMPANGIFDVMEMDKNLLAEMKDPDAIADIIIGVSYKIFEHFVIGGDHWTLREKLNTVNINNDAKMKQLLAYFANQLKSGFTFNALCKLLSGLSQFNKEHSYKPHLERIMPEIIYQVAYVIREPKEMTAVLGLVPSAYHENIVRNIYQFWRDNAEVYKHDFFSLVSLEDFSCAAKTLAQHMILPFIKSNHALMLRFNDASKMVEFIAAIINVAIPPMKDDYRSFKLNDFNFHFESHKAKCEAVLEIFQQYIKMRFKIEHAIALLSAFNRDFKNGNNLHSDRIIRRNLALCAMPVITNTDDLASVLELLHENDRDVFYLEQRSYWEKRFYSDRRVAFLCSIRSTQINDHGDFKQYRLDSNLTKKILFMAGLFRENTNTDNTAVRAQAKVRWR